MGEKSAEFSERRGTILKIIITEHIASAAPVGSESIARYYSLGISPATTRHEMARLEEEGYIVRPHTSAGGVPSAKGYRYYVGSLIREAKLSRTDQMAIRRFFEEAEQEPEAWARLAVTILTNRLESFALATLPRAPVCRFRHVNLIVIQELLILFVLVLQEGLIKKRLLSVAQTMSQDELSACASRLNAAYHGLSHRQITAKKIELSTMEEQITEVTVQMMQSEEKQQHEQFYLDGLRHLVNRAEFMQGKSMLRLVEAIEGRSVLSNLLCSLRDEPGIKVTIGDENKEEALQECSVILSSYGVDERKGAIGVIGPTRMPYNRAIPVVEYISAVMSELLGSVYE